MISSDLSINVHIFVVVGFMVGWSVPASIISAYQQPILVVRRLHLFLSPLASYYADTKVALNPFRQLGILARAHLPESGADTWLNLNFAAHNYRSVTLAPYQFIESRFCQEGLLSHTIDFICYLSLPLYGK